MPSHNCWQDIYAHFINYNILNRPFIYGKGEREIKSKQNGASNDYKL